jgi:hypothetical protein
MAQRADPMDFDVFPVLPSAEVQMRVYQGSAL